MSIPFSSNKIRFSKILTRKLKWPLQEPTVKKRLISFSNSVSDFHYLKILPIDIIMFIPFSSSKMSFFLILKTLANTFKGSL